MCEDRKTVRPSARASNDHLLELVLIQRIQPARRLVEDQHARAVHERLDQSHLLLVAVRVVPEPPAGVEVEPRDAAARDMLRSTPPRRLAK